MLCCGSCYGFVWLVAIIWTIVSFTVGFPWDDIQYTYCVGADCQLAED